MDLKWLLVRQITGTALACLLAGSAIALYGAAREATHENDRLVQLVSRQLDLQLSRIDRSTEVSERFPDWTVVTNYTLRPGQCVSFQGTEATPERSSCAGLDQASGRAPHWFQAAYTWLVGRHLTSASQVNYRGIDRGTIVASTDPAAMAAQAWSTIAPLIGLCTALVGLLCLVTYVVVDRALVPAKEILAGLNRLACGDLSVRLPAFRLAELDRISTVFNLLSTELKTATAERTDLARRLVDAQEQERRHIARELHDEIAQQLAAFSALAASIRTGAQHEAPSLAGEAKQLEELALALMRSVRGTLTYLRPQEIDDLGLVESLKDLVQQHNASARGRTLFSIETLGDVGQLRTETSAHVYRIVQEALTNASKHANAREVRVRLEVGDAGHEGISLSVIDNGAGTVRDDKPFCGTGSGLIGMRERVLALSGTFAAGPLPAGGYGLEIEFPAVQRGASAL